MDKARKRRLAEIKKGIVMNQVIAAPAAVLLGLGLYGVFAANGNAFHSLLNNQTVVYGMLIVGAILEGVQMMRLIPLLREQARVEKGNGV